MLAEVLIHHLDVARFLCGPLRVVAARAARTLPEVVGETLATVFLETASGAPVVVGGSMAAPGHFAARENRLGSSAAGQRRADGETLRLSDRPRARSASSRSGVTR